MKVKTNSVIVDAQEHVMHKSMPILY